ncbi:unnamed protein product [Rotaria socialis]|uniref:Uncharacterized protein n=1 Tax=Rotaria socialis TaxID=392032 RepID=A0A818H8P9_9BILA|nr:unnamed protein product [Rotaria socialis]CAF3420209.1 unnamed protein product [Rotaria socialis]CAF3430201.1 unnamed protein product [Rotaria socialis]CAF3490017.1 unnamed protein product [Rotaria socialis]CAF3504056.1 unnamed protein product [Rotaria socialis]
MDPTPKRRGRPRKSNVLPNTETIKPNVEKTKKTKPNDEPSVPKIENLLAMNAMVVQQRKAAKVKKKYKEASSEEEYVDEQVDEESDQYEEEEEEDENVARPNRRSSAAKRKSLAIQSKDQTESWGNYRNTIDNGPVPQHPLTLNETTFDVALKLQRRNQDRQLAIDYLDNENEIELIKDSKMTEQVLTDTYHIQLSQNIDGGCESLQPFESIAHKNNVFTLNTGIGPIQSLDWLSMPTAKCPLTHQYLAVGCSRSSLISKHIYDEIYSYKNYIQIWMFDLSNVKTNLTPKNHQLICLIAINDSGAIWGLKWSPSCSSPSAYLAAGTSSGSIYLYKIFSEQYLSSTESTNKILSFYQAKKTIRLSLNEPNNLTQCLAIDWSQHDPHRLAACYSNGFIALFHVNTEAKHLIEIKPNQEKIIFPIRCFRTSYTPIRDIKFLSDSSNLVLTIANIAKRFTVWDFDDHHQHLIDIENSGTESAIRTLTGDLLCVKEFTPSYARTSAYLTYEPETNNLPKHIYFQSTPDHVLSVDYSPWLDSVLLSDSNGQVYFFRVTNFVRWTRKNECSLKYRLKLFNLNAIIKPDKQEEVAKLNQEVGEPIFEQSSYTDLVDKYYLDANLCCDQKFVSKQDDFSKAGNHSLNALHKIRFNPNLGSYCWYAFGGESGLIFVLPLKQSSSNYAMSIYEKENKST